MSKLKWLAGKPNAVILDERGHVMPKLVKVLLMVVAGYAAGAVAGLLLVSLLSSNSHDKSMEMAMTAAFFTGPVGAAIGLVWGIFSRSSAAK